MEFIVDIFTVQLFYRSWSTTWIDLKTQQSIHHLHICTFVMFTYLSSAATVWIFPFDRLVRMSKIFPSYVCLCFFFLFFFFPLNWVTVCMDFIIHYVNAFVIQPKDNFYKCFFFHFFFHFFFFPHQCGLWVDLCNYMLISTSR